MKAYSTLTIGQALMEMYRKEGVVGFYKGNGVNVFRASPWAALEFLFYEIYKSLLIDSSNSNDFTAKLLWGALTGVTANTITYPLDLIKTILSVQLNPRHYKKGIIGHIKIIYQKEGILGFYKGWYTTMIGIAPYIAIKMATFDALKSKYLQNKNSPHFDLINLTFGAIAGITSMTATYPFDFFSFHCIIFNIYNLFKFYFDLIKRKMQLIGVNKHFRRYESLIHWINSVMVHDGPKGFFKGLTPCILKIVPATAILFSVNERLKKMIGI